MSRHIRCGIAFACIAQVFLPSLAYAEEPSSEPPSSEPLPNSEVPSRAPEPETSVEKLPPPRAMAPPDQPDFAPLRPQSLELAVRAGPSVLVAPQAPAYVVPTLGFEGLRWFTRAFGVGGALDLGLHRQGTTEANVLELRTQLRSDIETRILFRDAFGFRLGAGPGFLWSFKDIRAGGHGESVHRFAPTLGGRLSFDTRVSDTATVSIGALGSVDPEAIECFAFVSYAWAR